MINLASSMEVALPISLHCRYAPLIQEKFLYNGQQTRLALFQNSICFWNSMTIQYHKITFDIKYQIIREDHQQVLVILSPTPLKFYSNLISQLFKRIISQRINYFIPIDNLNFADFLGKGYSARVFKSLKCLNGKQYAIKVLEKKSSNPEFKIQGLYNEISLLRRINHPNICKLYEVLQSQDFIYLVMQLVQGKNLDSLFSSKIPLDKKFRKKLIKEILLGLDELSKKNILHRDIKPQNVLVNKNNQIKIIDFGLATDVNVKEYLFIRCGSPGFIAPQIMCLKQLENVRLTPKSDVFSAGCLFYEMIFGRILFGEGHPERIIQQNQMCNFQIPYTSSLSDCQQLDLLRKMLKKQPVLRISASQALNHSYFYQQYKALSQVRFNKNQFYGLRSSKLQPLNYQSGYRVPYGYSHIRPNIN